MSAHRLRAKKIVVTGRYIYHFNQIDHLIGQDQYRSLNELKLATQSKDFSGGRVDSFGALDTEKKIAKYIFKDMSYQKRFAKLSR